MMGLSGLVTFLGKGGVDGREAEITSGGGRGGGDGGVVGGVDGGVLGGGGGVEGSGSPNAKKPVCSFPLARGRAGGLFCVWGS